MLTRVDGIRLPWLDDGARGVKGGLEAVDFNSLSRLDIVRGADASAGGSGAISGMADLLSLIHILLRSIISMCELPWMPRSGSDSTVTLAWRAANSCTRARKIGRAHV